MITNSSFIEHDFDNHLIHFYKGIIDLSEDFNINSYIKLTQDIKECFGLNTTMVNSQNYIPHFTEYTYLRLILITDYLLNLKHIFFSITNNTLSISYDFILSLLERKYYNDINYTISLVYKLVHKQKYLNNDIAIRLQDVARGLPSCALSDIILKRLKLNHTGSRKELIKVFQTLDNELEAVHVNNKSESSISLIDSLDDFRTRVRDQLTSDAILQLYHSNFVQNMYDKASLTCGDEFKDEYMKYLYIVKKTIDHIDSMAKKDHYIQRLFINMLMRSKTFLRCLLSQVTMENNFIYFSNKDIYIETYGVLGKYLEEIIKYDKISFGYYKNVGVELVRKVKELLACKLDEHINNKTIQKYYFTDSLLNDSHVSYTTCFPTQSLNHNWLGLDLNIQIDKKYEEEVIQDITSLINRIKGVKKLHRKENVIYADFEIKSSHSLMYTLVLTVNSPIIFRGNELYEIIKGNDLYIDLFICLKFWAIQRSFLMTPKDIEIRKPDHSNPSCFFDWTLLLFYTIYYLIKVRALEPLKADGFKAIYKILKIDEERNFYYEQYKVYRYNNSYSDKHKFDKVELAKLFINFFHFNTSIVNSALQKDHRTMNLDLNCSDIAVSQTKYNALKFTDFLVYSWQDGKLNHESEQSEINEEEVDISLKDKHQRKILNSLNRDELSKLNHESLRVLNYVLEEPVDGTNLRFAKIFLANKIK
jgi:hypothetical protein